MADIRPTVAGPGVRRRAARPRPGGATPPQGAQGRAALLLLAVSALLGCDRSGGTEASASGAPGSADIIVSARPLDEQGEAARERAADQLFPLLEKVSSLVKEHRKEGTLDCPNLATAIEAFADEQAGPMKEIVQKGGGKLAVRRALEKKFGERYEALTDELLEAVGIECKAEGRVAKAAERLDL